MVSSLIKKTAILLTALSLSIAVAASATTPDDLDEPHSAQVVEQSDPFVSEVDQAPDPVQTQDPVQAETEAKQELGGGPAGPLEQE